MSKLESAPRKLMDSNRLYSLSWNAQFALEVGVAQACADFCESE